MIARSRGREIPPSALAGLKPARTCGAMFPPFIPKLAQVATRLGLRVLQAHFFEEPRSTKQQRLAFRGIGLKQSPHRQTLAENEKGLLVVSIAERAGQCLIHRLLPALRRDSAMQPAAFVFEPELRRGLDDRPHSALIHLTQRSRTTPQPRHSQAATRNGIRREHLRPQNHLRDLLMEAVAGEKALLRRPQHQMSRNRLRCIGLLK